ncbi:MAG: Crp/Fnr family transcriptional regulator [Pseudomonadota bacterium]
MEDLTKSPLFSGLSSAEIKKLTKNFVSKNVKTEHIIIEQGKPAEKAYILTEGRVEVFYISKGGHKTTVIYHKAPFIFGEIELLQNRPYVASVVATGSCKFLEITQEEYLELLNANQKVAVNMVKLLSALLYRFGEDHRVRYFGKIEHLLANLICYYADMYGEELDYGVMIGKRISKRRFGEVLGVSRQNVVKAFDSLSETGLICFEGKQIIIPDILLLKKKASYV